MGPPSRSVIRAPASRTMTVKAAISRILTSLSNHDILAAVGQPMVGIEIAIAARARRLGDDIAGQAQSGPARQGSQIAKADIGLIQAGAVSDYAPSGR